MIFDVWMLIRTHAYVWHLFCPVCATAHCPPLSLLSLHLSWVMCWRLCVFVVVVFFSSSVDSKDSIYQKILGMKFVIHYSTSLPVSFSIWINAAVVSPSPVYAAVCSAGHHGGWGGTHHLPRYGLPKDWSATGLWGMPCLKPVICRS